MHFEWNMQKHIRYISFQKGHSCVVAADLQMIHQHCNNDLWQTDQLSGSVNCKTTSSAALGASMRSPP